MVHISGATVDQKVVEIFYESKLHVFFLEYDMDFK